MMIGDTGKFRKVEWYSEKISVAMPVTVPPGELTLESNGGIFDGS